MAASPAVVTRSTSPRAAKTSGCIPSCAPIGESCQQVPDSDQYECVADTTASPAPTPTPTTTSIATSALQLSSLNTSRSNTADTACNPTCSDAESCEQVSDSKQFECVPLSSPALSHLTPVVLPRNDTSSGLLGPGGSPPALKAGLTGN